MIPIEFECENCGRHHQYKHEFDKCPECGKEICYECSMQIKEEGFYVCQECYEKWYDKYYYTYARHEKVINKTE